MKKLGKKGTFSIMEIPNVALAFLLIAVFFVVAIVVLVKLQANDAVQTSTAANEAITNAITATAEIPNNWLTIIAVVIAAGVIIGVVVGYLGRSGGMER